MQEKCLQSSDVRKRTLESDNSDLFSKWGSRHPELTIREEIDNQISANPTFAGFNIMHTTGRRCTITTFNDGETPTPERMENMYRIGKTISDRKGASVCGVGQIEGLIAGRKESDSIGTLTFKSIHNRQLTKFTCEANGTDYSVVTETSGPYPTNNRDIVEKTYEEMKDFTDEEIEKMKVWTAVKVYPYAKAHPNFKYTVNGEEIVPFGVLYDGVTDETVKRMDVKDYVITYHDKEYIVKAGAVDVAKYVKPDGKSCNLEHADELDKMYKMSPESGGIFVEVGGVNVITGGRDSWEFINKKYHTTNNGQRVWIQIQSQGELKDAIFAESQNKSKVSIGLHEIHDYDGKLVFQELLDDITKHLNSWKNDREIIKSDGESVTKGKQKEVVSNIFNNDDFVLKLQEALGMLTDEERLILGTKKFSTIVSKTNRSIDRQIKALDKEIEKKRKLYNKAIVQLDKEMAKLENEVSEYNNNNLNKKPKVCYKRAE